MCGVFAGFLLTGLGVVLALAYLAVLTVRYHPLVAVILLPFSGVALCALVAVSGVAWPLPLNFLSTCGGIPHDPSNLFHYFVRS